MKGNTALDFTVEGLLEQTVTKNSLFSAVTTSHANRHHFP